MKSLEELVRPNIWNLTPYSSARDEFKGEASVFLDANESPYNAPYNRYPDPLQTKLKEKIAEIKELPAESIFLGNGSDEAIDLLYRIFCTPGQDNVVAIEPTYGMYKVAADINQVDYRPVSLNPDFTLNDQAIIAACDAHTKLVFLCSPNNPTGNSLSREGMLRIAEHAPGMVVVDEAYGDFAQQPSLRSELKAHPNLVLLSTFSKAWASAGVRLGMAFARPEVIALFNKVKYPYNINNLTAEYALKLTARRYDIRQWVRTLLRERQRLIAAVALLPICLKVYPTDANFFLVKVTNATLIYNYLMHHGIVVRNRTRVALCRDCLRITVGSPSENSALLAALRAYKEGME